MGIFDKFFKETQESIDWPNDADGDVLRRMKESGFDFSKIHSIDFNIDLQEWPPEQGLVDALIAEYGDIQGYEPEENVNGYLQFQINDKVTYELVTKTQENATKLAVPFGGVCESWGVMQE